MKHFSYLLGTYSQELMCMNYTFLNISFFILFLCSSIIKLMRPGQVSVSDFYQKMSSSKISQFKQSIKHSSIDKSTYDVTYAKKINDKKVEQKIQLIIWESCQGYYYLGYAHSTTGFPQKLDKKPIVKKWMPFALINKVNIVDQTLIVSFSQGSWQFKFFQEEIIMKWKNLLQYIMVHPCKKYQVKLDEQVKKNQKLEDEVKELRQQIGFIYFKMRQFHDMLSKKSKNCQTIIEQLKVQCKNLLVRRDEINEKKYNPSIFKNQREEEVIQIYTMDLQSNQSYEQRILNAFQLECPLNEKEEKRSYFVQSNRQIVSNGINSSRSPQQKASDFSKQSKMQVYTFSSQKSSQNYNLSESSRSNSQVSHPSLYHYATKTVETKFIKLNRLEQIKEGRKQIQHFKKLLFNMHAFLIKFLSQKDMKNKVIATYYFDQKKAVRNKEEPEFYDKFLIKSALGLKPYIFDKNNITKETIKQLFFWINCFVEGIIELQKIGIFHEDLKWQNILKFSEKIGKNMFKIIDFGWALKVTPDQNGSYTTTRKLIQFLVSFQGSQEIQQQLFDQLIRDITENKKIKLRLKKEEKIPEENKIEYFMRQLYEYMFYYHKTQFKSQLSHFFKDVKENYIQNDEFLSVSAMQKIMKSAQNIPEIEQGNEQGYRQFLEVTKKYFLKLQLSLSCEI